MTDMSCTCAYHPELTNWHLPSCPLAVAPERPALLTDEAVRAASSGILRPGGASGAFIEHHRTEGREALVEAVMQQIAVGFRLTVPMEDESRLRAAAEAVVAALVGERRRCKCRIDTDGTDLYPDGKGASDCPCCKGSGIEPAGGCDEIWWEFDTREARYGE